MPRGAGGCAGGPRRSPHPTTLSTVGEPAATNRRGWWIGLAAALAAFLAVAVGLTMAAAGPGPALPASSAPHPDRPLPLDRPLPPDATAAGCATPRTSCVG